MTTPCVVGAINAEVAEKVTRRLGLVLNRHRCSPQLPSCSSDDAASGAAEGVSRRATSLLGFTTMLESAAAESGLDHLGLLLAQVDTENEQELIRRLFKHAPTLRQAIEDLIHFFPAIQTGTLVRLHKEGSAARIIYSIQDPSVPDSLQDSAYTLGRLCHTLRRAAGDSWRLNQVTMAMPSPRSPELYAHLFQAPVAFDESATALCFPAWLLDVPIRTANPNLHALLCCDMKRLMPDHVDAALWEDALRAWMAKTLNSSAPATLEHAASDFGITPRTLQRRLQGLGISFLDLRTQVRIEAARQLLAGSSLSVTRISDQLGFSEISAFTRAFRTHTRQSPRAFRRAFAAAA